MTLLAVIVSGGFGAACRFLLAGWLQRHSPFFFPVGTMTVNIVGCFLVGWLATSVGMRWLENPILRTAVLSGFLGAFTTFSTFGFESFEMLREGMLVRALAYMAGSLLLGILAVGLGVWTASHHS